MFAAQHAAAFQGPSSTECITWLQSTAHVNTVHISATVLSAMHMQTLLHVTDITHKLMCNCAAAQINQLILPQIHLAQQYWLQE